MSYTYKYPRPAVTADIILLRKQKDSIEVLLIERGHEPFKGCWALPGGFMDIDEEIETTAYRELKEETGIEANDLKQFRTYATIGRDPRGRTVSVVFWGIASRTSTARAGDDAAKIKWYDLYNLPPLAFDHEVILKDFINEKENEFRIALTE